MDISLFVQLIITLIMLFSVILIYRTIKSNEKSNQNLLFNEIVKQERELRIKLQEYADEIKKSKGEKKENLVFAYETLLFNYYEYLAICVYKNLIDVNATRLYFRDLLISVRQVFKKSLMFEKEYVQKEEYKGLQWLFKNWST